MVNIATALYVLGVVLPPAAVILGLAVLMIPKSTAHVPHTSEHATAH